MKKKTNELANCCFVGLFFLVAPLRVMGSVLSLAGCFCSTGKCSVAIISRGCGVYPYRHRARGLFCGRIFRPKP